MRDRPTANTSSGAAATTSGEYVVWGSGVPPDGGVADRVDSAPSHRSRPPAARSSARSACAGVAVVVYSRVAQSGTTCRIEWIAFSLLTFAQRALHAQDSVDRRRALGVGGLRVLVRPALRAGARRADASPIDALLLSLRRKHGARRSDDLQLRQPDALGLDRRARSSSRPPASRRSSESPAPAGWAAGPARPDGRAATSSINSGSDGVDRRDRSRAGRRSTSGASTSCRWRRRTPPARRSRFCSSSRSGRCTSAPSR